ncbi:MAG: hypothetical protein WCV81_00180 [Microgenomates group bacterium]|jgi:hypothetical protein
MRGEKEHYINPKARVWIGNQIKPVPEGTYYRYYTSSEPGNKLNITFKRIDLSEKEYNRRLMPMSIELIPTTPRKTDTLSSTGGVTLDEAEAYKIVGKIRCFDEFFPQIFKDDIIRQQKLCPTPLTQDSNHIVITDEDLRSTKSAGFFIENCGCKTPFPTDEIIAVISDHVLSTITIQKRGVDGQAINSTYSLKKIKNCGKLPKKD